MSEEGDKSIYPSMPLEEKIEPTQQQHPLIANVRGERRPPQPPTYEQATVETTPALTSRLNIVNVTEPVTPYGPSPVDVQCPYCHNFCRTRLSSKPSSRTHLIALLLCILQLYCCICLPYCIGSCMNTNHYCGICGKYLGTFRR